MSPESGISLVLVNNEKGSEILSAISSNFDIEEKKIEDSMQKALKKSSRKPMLYKFAMCAWRRHNVIVLNF